MKVELIEHTKLSNACRAGRTCWDSFHKGGCYPTPTDNITEEDRNFLDRVINANGHASIAEHLVYTFDIHGISRACLQEVARHRIASYSVQSSRYTLTKILKNGVEGTYTKTGITSIDEKIEDALITIANNPNIANDKLKYMIPEAMHTTLVGTFNARSLQNFLRLRTSKSALKEIRKLAYAMYAVIPEDHRYLFEGCINE